MSAKDNTWFKYDKRIRWQMLDKPRELTILRFGEIEKRLGNEKVTVPAIWFKETPKYLELNDTNRMFLFAQFGKMQSACIGKRVMLKAERVQNGKNGVVLYPAEQLIASASGLAPAKAEDAPRDDHAKMWDIMNFHEIPDPEVVLDLALEDAQGDTATALAALEAKYGKAPA